MTSTVTVKGPRWVAEIQQANGIMVGGDFQFREQMMQFIKEHRGEVEITQLYAGQELTYIKYAQMRKVGT